MWLGRVKEPCLGEALLHGWQEIYSAFSRREKNGVLTRYFSMESGVISQQNSVYVLNSSYNSADMLSLFVAPTVKYEHNKCVQSMMSTLQTKIPQKTEKDTFNEKTRKSLLKINLFIKRLKWFNIFTDSPASRTTTSSKAQGTNCAQISKETNPKCKKFINSKKTSSTKEMYREAAKLLGIDCSLSSSCRCYNCQSSYFDYPMEQVDESEDDNSESDCDTDSYSSDDLQLSDEDRYTNCFLIHSEELCEFCCKKDPPSSMSTDIACNDFGFSTFLS